MSRIVVGILLSIAIAVLTASLWFLKMQPAEIDKQLDESQPVLGATTTTKKPNDSIPDAEKLYGLINGYRREQNLSPLTAHTALEQSARLKLNDMLEKKYWRHGDTDNYPPWRFFTQAGYQYSTAGENLAFGVATTWQTFTRWQESQAHNEQLLEPTYEHMGIAVECDFYEAYAGKTCLVVLHLGRN